MAENTKIEWADHTFNPWTGCQAVSPACDNCYADALVSRFGGDFSVRKRTSAANWNQPLAWNRRAEKLGIRYRVFCASLADVFDNKVPTEWRLELWALIHETPHLDWLLLTKRPQNIAKMLPHEHPSFPAWGDGWAHVWLGCTAENQTEADRRIPHLLAVPAKVHFLSCEPLLSALDLSRWLDPDERTGCGDDDMWSLGAGSLDWVIAGGESGRHARPSHPDWFRSLRYQCVAAGVAYHFKQWGEWLIGEREEIGDGWPRINFQDGHHFNIAGDGRDTVLETADDHRGEPLKIWREFWADGAGNLAKRPGKKAAGRALDGREWNGVPG